MRTGGSGQGQMVTLTDITCPVLGFFRFYREVDDIGQPGPCAVSGGGAERPRFYESRIRKGIFFFPRRSLDPKPHRKLAHRPRWGSGRSRWGLKAAAIDMMAISRSETPKAALR